MPHYTRIIHSRPQRNVYINVSCSAIFTMCSVAVMSEDGGSSENVDRRRSTQRKTITQSAGSFGYPIIKQRGFYSEILVPESEHRLGVSIHS